MATRILCIIGFALLSGSAYAGGTLVPAPDSDTNVVGPKPGASNGPCVVNGMILQDCAPRNFRKSVTPSGIDENGQPRPRLAPQNRNGNRLVPQYN
jgi:hypothetical protein